MQYHLSSSDCPNKCFRFKGSKLFFTSILAVAMLTCWHTQAVQAQVATRFDAALHKEIGGFAFGKMTGNISYNLSTPSTSTFTVDTGDIAFPGDTTFGGMGFASWGSSGWLLDVNDDPNVPANQLSNNLLEIKFKPLATNTATQFNVNVRDFDGFDVTRGQLIGDDHQYTVFMGDPSFGNDTDNSDGVTSTTDPITGFITWRRDVVVAPADFVFSSLADLGLDEGDRFLNLNAVATPGFVNDNLTVMGTPILGDNGGMRELQIQSAFGGIDRLHIEVENAGFTPVTPGAEKARFDYRNTSFSFGSFLTAGAYVKDNASNNIEINADGEGGAGVNNAATTFDGTANSVQITARVLGANTAGKFSVNLKDIDGDDSAAGVGGELYQVILDTADFDAAGAFVTITVPISSAVLGNATASEFVNTGDADITDFNLYQIQISNIVDVALTADFDASGSVDAADLALWQAAFGVDASADADGDGDSDGNDFLVWQSQLGSIGGAAGILNLEVQDVQIVSTLPAVAAVPEPSSALLAMIALAGSLVVSRRNRLAKC